MSNNYFKFKQFIIYQDKAAMKVGVDSVLLGSLVKCDNANEVLDIGTGTGLLALMIAQKTTAKITAIEIDENAYLQAGENIKNSKWNNIKLINTSVQEFKQNVNKKFDLIICNPPYFSKSLNSSNMQRSVARHDNHLPISELFESVSYLLSYYGKFYMIYPYDRKTEVLDIAKKLELIPYYILSVKGNEKKNPNRVIFEFGHNAPLNNNSKYVLTEEQELIVRNSITNQYTGDYMELTKDYYL